MALSLFFWSYINDFIGFKFILGQKIDEFLGVNTYHQVSHLMFLERSLLPFGFIITIGSVDRSCKKYNPSPLTPPGKARRARPHAAASSTVTNTRWQEKTHWHCATHFTPSHTSNTRLPSTVLALHGLWIIHTYTQRHWQIQTRVAWTQMCQYTLCYGY